MGILPVLAVVALIAWAIWEVRRRRASSSAFPGAGPSTPGLRLPFETFLDRWTDAGLMGADQAEAIRAFEVSAAIPVESPAGRVPIVAEVIGYAGAALACAGAAAATAQVWDDMAWWARVSVLGGTSAALIAAGWLLRRSREAAFQRLRSVLWFVSLGFLAASLGVLWADRLDDHTQLGALVVGATVTLVAYVLWRQLPAAPQQIALLAGSTTTVVGGILAIPGDASVLWYALGVWAVGSIWALLGRRDALAPPWLALAAGITMALIAPTIAIDEHGWVLAPALVMAVACMIGSVPLDLPPLAIMGAVATFTYVVWAVVRYFGDTLGVPVALGLIGGLLVVVAVAVGRDRLQRLFRFR